MKENVVVMYVNKRKNRAWSCGEAGFVSSITSILCVLCNLDILISF